MDIKAYISSGILENFVLGLLSESERKEVEQNILKFPQLREELNKIEEALESYAKSKAISAPAGLLDTIMEQIKPEDNPPVELTKNDKSTKSRFWIIAAILATLLSLLFMWMFYQKNNQLGEIEQQNKTLQEECDSKESELLSKIDILRNEGGLIIAMAGTDKAPDALTKVYWNDEQETAYLDIFNLPKPPSGKQYQLWAIVDGTPVDMGVFDISPNDTLVPAPFIENPAAFAITLEPAGGSESPTLEEMVVIGQI